MNSVIDEWGDFKIITENIDGVHVPGYVNIYNGKYASKCDFQELLSEAKQITSSNSTL